jgi:Nuclease-related domain
MVIKAPDDKTQIIATLEELKGRRDASADVCKRIEQELRNINAGIRGENESIYEIDFNFGASKNYMVIHDLRIECEGRVAQIDHLVINRFLEFWVCESKHFSEGIAINEQGECAAFYNNKPYGVASPIEQNKKHILVLKSLFSSGMVELPKRLGFAIQPNMHSVILVSKKARISRPKAKVDGVESIMKNDQFRSLIDRAIDADNNPLTMARLIGTETLESLARAIAAQHKPIEFRWAAKFGLTEMPVKSEITLASEETMETDDKKPKKKLICAKCSASVEFQVARFCWLNKKKFGENIYCRECQKAL